MLVTDYLQVTNLREQSRPTPSGTGTIRTGTIRTGTIRMGTIHTGTTPRRRIRTTRTRRTRIRRIHIPRIPTHPTATILTTVEAHTLGGATRAVPVQQAERASIGLMANATMAVPVRSILRARAVAITATAPLVHVAARHQALAHTVMGATQAVLLSSQMVHQVGPCARGAGAVIGTRQEYSVR